MDYIFLPIVDEYFMRDLMHVQVGRKDQPIPTQASIDAYCRMKELSFEKHSNYHNVSAQLTFEDISIVLRRDIKGSPFDASYSTTGSAVSFYKNEMLVGSMVHYHPDTGPEMWNTNMDLDTVETVSPVLQALRIYGWVRTYVIPRQFWNDPGHEQLDLIQNAAFPFYEDVKTTALRINGMNVTDLPGLPAESEKIKIEYFDLS